MKPLLQVEDLCVDYHTPKGPVRAVDHVSFTIHEGEVLGLAGESGSGKSTVAHALLRTLGPPAVITGGHVRFRGRDILDMGEEELRRLRWREIAVVFQSAMDALNPVLTVGEQLIDTIQAHEPESLDKARMRAGELLQMVGIDPGRLDAYPHHLSGGMRQRVVIAMAVALRPSLLLMDEPTTALDVVVEKEILKEIDELKRDLGFSILFISHDLSRLLELSDQVGVLYSGRMCELAPAHQIQHDPQHPYTQGLLQAFPLVTGPIQQLSAIEGAPPSLADPPPGCRFHPRCPRAIDRCREEQPSWTWLDSDRGGACHHFD